MENQLVCISCGNSVVTNAHLYDVFEKMHWICFHFVFEHDGDSDKPCGDLTCPLWRIKFLENFINDLGYDSQKVISKAIDDEMKR